MAKMKSEILKNYLILTITMLLIELILRPIVGLQYLDWALLRIIISINFIGLFLAIIISIFPRVLATILNFVLIIGVSVYAFFQIGFNNSIGTFISVNSSSQLEKVTSYIVDYVTNYPWYFYLILVPLLLMIILQSAMHCGQKTHMRFLAFPVHTLKKQWISVNAVQHTVLI